MRYFIKPIGEKDNPRPFSGEWFQLMVTKHMAHATLTSLVRSVSPGPPGDKFVLFCINGRFTDIAGGGFIGIQTVKSKVYEDATKFGEPWVYINDVSLDFPVNLNGLIPISEVRRWPNQSGLLAKALRANLQWFPVREIAQSDYDDFERALRARAR